MVDKNVEIFDEVISKIAFYIPLLTIIVGTIGSLCNIITFTSKFPSIYHIYLSIYILN